LREESGAFAFYPKGCVEKYFLIVVCYPMVKLFAVFYTAVLDDINIHMDMYSIYYIRSEIKS